MTVHLPTYVGARVGAWALVDVVRKVLTGDTDGTGAATLRFPTIDADRWWQVIRAVITCGGHVDPQPSCLLYVVPAGTDPAPQYQQSGTDAGLFDEADYPGEGMWVLENEDLVAVWTGAPVNQPVSVNLQLRLFARTPA